ncbi:uncharacterized protein LOC117112054 isoform X2 [Anneissia japonica]|uniref:uncharacterized protein LOC117112054 isoform X2 n=1 Tax=Anneissia japonica TaxID=1529436 RepID=UPI00142598F0|nr:uncharacterized protein LOC117112054 isoform X2 [Anneissia japonica]
MDALLEEWGFESLKETFNANDPKPSLAVESVEVTDDINMKVQWLKDNLEPKNQVQQFMTTTFNYRIEWIKDKQRSVSDILKEFPRLLDNDMIDQDFRSSYPEAADRMYEFQIINVQAYVDSINPETHRQPFILALGGKVHPSDQFIIIENKVIQQPSLFKAVDVCYKLHYVPY